MGREKRWHPLAAIGLILLLLAPLIVMGDDKPPSGISAAKKGPPPPKSKIKIETVDARLNSISGNYSDEMESVQAATIHHNTLAHATLDNARTKWKASFDTLPAAHYLLVTETQTREPQYPRLKFHHHIRVQHTAPQRGPQPKSSPADKKLKLGDPGFMVSILGGVLQDPGSPTTNFDYTGDSAGTANDMATVYGTYSDPDAAITDLYMVPQNQSGHLNPAYWTDDGAGHWSAPFGATPGGDTLSASTTYYLVVVGTSTTLIGQITTKGP